MQTKNYFLKTNKKPKNAYFRLLKSTIIMVKFIFPFSVWSICLYGAIALGPLCSESSTQDILWNFVSLMCIYLQKEHHLYYSQPV